MAESALRTRSRRPLVAAAGALAALAPAIALRGFTVDDALISARYAANLAHGAGYRFNAGGAVTDGVTPLGWAYVLAPFAGSGPLAALAAAKVMGAIAWAIAAAVLALAVDEAGRGGESLAEPGNPASPPRSAAWLRYAVLLLLAASAPLGAWSVAGMETGVVAALTALAVALPELGRPLAGAACAGIAAAFRPEVLPFTIVLAAAPLPRGATSPRVARLALAMAPFAIVAGARLALFGRVVPLSSLAKPADAGLGASYAAACFLLTGPIAIVAPLAWRRLDGWARGLVIAVIVHFAAVAAAGGDWMPLSRLVVPALPAALLAAAHLAAVADARATAARVALALAGEVFQVVKVGPAAAGVGEARRRVIDELRAPLAEAKVAAALDIGWLGAATGATIVDLAGVTDPAIAVLAGGHTSKRISPLLLDERKVDTLVLLLAEGRSLAEPWETSSFSRNVEYRVARLPGVAEAFVPVAESRVPHLRYVVLRRREK